MAEKLYRQGLLGWLTGFDPNNPTAPRKLTLSPASTNGRGGANRPPAKPVAAPTPPPRSDYPSKPATSGAPFNPSGKRSVIKSGPDPLSANPTKRNVSATSGAPFNPSGKRSVIKSGPDPLSANPTKRNVSLQVAAGRGQAKGVPEPARNPRPTAGRPPELPFSRKSPEAAAKQVVANAAASGTPKAKPAPAKQAVTSPAPSSAPKTNPAPASKKSWWDRFSEDHKLSADKSYADYKRLMGDN